MRTASNARSTLDTAINYIREARDEFENYIDDLESHVSDLEKELQSEKDENDKLTIRIEDLEAEMLARGEYDGE